MLSVLITGAAGNLGGLLARHLLAAIEQSVSSRGQAMDFDAVIRNRRQPNVGARNHLIPGDIPIRAAATDDDIDTGGRIR